MLKQEIFGLIARLPALAELPENELESLVEGAALDYFPRGERILAQGGTRSEQLYVIKRGTVSMSIPGDGGEIVIDYRGEGEYFGLISAVSGDPPRANAVAEEDTIALLIQRRTLLAALERNPKVSDRLLKSYFIDFIDKTVEETRQRYGRLSNEHRLLFATPAGDLVRRPPITVTEDTPIQQGARLMAEHKISSLVVVSAGGEPMGIVTDRDLREKVVARARDPRQPVSRIMSSSLVTVDAAAASSEALFKMMRHGIHHLLVTEDGSFRGMLTNHDLMVQQGSSPALLVRKVTEAESLERLAETCKGLERTVSTLTREGATADDVTRVVTEVTDKLLVRVAALCEDRLGPAPLPYSLFVIGEAGRRELALDRRLRLGLAFHDSGDERQDGDTATYLAGLGDELGRALGACGVTASGPGAGVGPVRSFSAWHELFGTRAAAEDDACDLFRCLEIRPVRGDSQAVIELRSRLLGAIAESDARRARMAAAVVANPPPLGFLRRFVVATSGEHRHQLDLYEKGLRPLVDAVRVLAAERAVASLSTRERLAALRDDHPFPEAEALANALEYLQTLRLHQQLARVAEGRQPDNFLDPEGVTPAERKTLKETFQLTAGLHEALARRYGVGSRR